MTNDHENSIILGIVCKWRNKGDLTIHTFSTIVEYKYHGILDIKNININPVSILHNNFRDRIELDDIEVLDKTFYTCTPIDDNKNKTDIYENVKYDATFVMPY